MGRDPAGVHVRIDSPHKSVQDLIAAIKANPGAWIPALVFGIPGDSITAIVIGVLYNKDLHPGPTIFMDNAVALYAIFRLHPRQPDPASARRGDDQELAGARE